MHRLRGQRLPPLRSGLVPPLPAVQGDRICVQAPLARLEPPALRVGPVTGLPAIAAITGALLVVACGVLVALASRRPWPVTVYRDDSGPLLRGSLVAEQRELAGAPARVHVITDLPADP